MNLRGGVIGWILMCVSAFMLVACSTTQSLQDQVATVLAEFDLSGSVYVTKRGVTIFSNGYGMANRELALPNSPVTKFRIGSMTKQFTAMAILILQDQGALSVEDQVGDYIKDAPKAWLPLTIHQLLTHTSGIMHSWALPEFVEAAKAPITLDSTLRLFHDQPLLFEPGKGLQYSGTGYFLLAKIIEVVSKKSYAEFLDAEIFTPLGMKDTGADRPDIVLPNRANGYIRGADGTVQRAPTIFMPIMTGGGNLYSTVVDLSRWDRALAQHALVSKAAYTAMYRPEQQNYAYGWQVSRLNGETAIYHGGGVPGFNSFILRLLEQDVCVIVLTNMTPGQALQVAQEVYYLF